MQDGRLLGWLGRTETSLLTFVEDPTLSSALAEALARWAKSGERNAVLIEKVDGVAVAESPWAKVLAAAGFRKGSKGLLLRRFD